MLDEFYKSMLAIFGILKLTPQKKYELRVLLQQVYSKGLKDMLSMQEIEKKEDSVDVG